MKKITAGLVWAEAERLSQHRAGEDYCVAYAILLASVVVGPNMRKIAKYLSIRQVRFEWMADNLRRSGIWRRDKVISDMLDRKNGGVALALDVAVALGFLTRVTKPKKAARPREKP